MALAFRMDCGYNAGVVPVERLGKSIFAMIGDRVDEPQRFGGVRRSVWTLLIATVLLALAVPTVTIWHAAHATIDASAFVWPAAPTVGHPAEFCVVVSDPSDRAAVHGPWGQIVAAWDMPTMVMQEQRQAKPGDSTSGGVRNPADTSDGRRVARAGGAADAGAPRMADVAGRDRAQRFAAAGARRDEQRLVFYRLYDALK